MTAESSAFESALTLGEAGSDGAFSAEIGQDWAQGRTAFGGLVAALMARALARVLPHERALRSALIDFMAPVAAGPVRLETKLLRVGRALTHAEVRLLQEGEPRALLLAACGETRATPLRLPGAGPAPLAGPEQLLKLPYVEGVMPRFTKHFDFRLSADAVPFSGAQRARLQGYVRHPDAGPVDSAGLLGLLDAWPPAITPLLARHAPVSTVSWMVDFVGAPPDPGARSDAFYRYEAHGLSAEGGYASCEARLWDGEGRLLAVSRQMVVEFS